MKISIIYASQTGNTEAAAEYIMDGILAKHPFIQVKMMNVRENEVDLEFLNQSEAVIFGSPVYFTGMSWELKKWFDQSFRIKLNGKFGTAFVTANSLTGGTDTAIMDIMRHMLAKGMFVFSGEGSQPLGAFQMGAVVLAKELDKYAGQLEALGVNVADAVTSFERH